MTNTVCTKTGDFISAMIAVKRKGLIIAIGEQLLHYQKEMVLAMDPHSRLIISLQPPSVETLPIEEMLKADLRVAVHRQEIQEFLDDIGHHRFKLIILGEERINDSLIAQCVEILELGGILLMLQGPPANDPPNLDHYEQCWSASLDFCHLLVKSDRDKKPVRRGGRKARLACQY